MTDHATTGDAINHAVDKAARLYQIKTQMDAAAEWFANHEPRASEIAARKHIEDIKFLLSLIET